MEKYKYCNIGPASSPRVGGREGGKGLCMIDIRFEESVGRKGTDFFYPFGEKREIRKWTINLDYKSSPLFDLTLSRFISLFNSRLSLTSFFSRFLQIKRKNACVFPLLESHSNSLQKYDQEDSLLSTAPVNI